MLARPRFGFDADSAAALLDYIDFRSEVVASEPLEQRLPDPDDGPSLEVAAASGADCLVTGKLAHFPSNIKARVTALSPAHDPAAASARSSIRVISSRSPRSERAHSTGRRSTPPWRSRGRPRGAIRPV
ncbi:MAG: putative toxin-antitoxin system toxin component, PIN family [Thermoleophilia bacterium]